jgi:hypothetical protein
VRVSELLRIGSGDDEIVDHADWVEISTLFKADGSVSREDLSRALFRARGGSEQSARVIAEDAFNELRDRASSCVRADGSSGYPFRFSKDGATLHRQFKARRWSKEALPYLFLLAVTRSDMSSKKRKRAGIDPTALFETLCAEVLLDFWGGHSRHSNSIVFHSSPKMPPLGKFASNVQTLSEQLSDGGGWKVGARSPKGGDGKLDLVVWRKFSDGRAGALSGFAQCKTGIHWRDHLAKLEPAAFSGKFMRQQLIVSPVRIYMVPNRIVKSRWDDDSRDGGLLLDRCRITQFCAAVTPSVLAQCRAWMKPVIGPSTGAAA